VPLPALAPRTARAAPTDRFTDAEDTLRDEQRRHDDGTLRSLGAQVAGLARGEGIFAEWPVPPPAAAVPASPLDRPRVVPHRAGRTGGNHQNQGVSRKGD
jgi:hypothetical protein